MVINQTMDQNGFCQVPGADVKEHNFLCPAIGAGRGAEYIPTGLEFILPCDWGPHGSC